MNDAAKMSGDEIGTGLVRYTMINAIAEVHSFDEILLIRDRAAQIAAAAKVAKNFEAERQCREIRDGELSKELPRAAGNQYASPHGAEKQNLLARRYLDAASVRVGTARQYP